MMKPFTLQTLMALLCVLFTCAAQAQLSEKFDDGNFTHNPTWIDDANSWIVNAQGQLQSNNQTSNTSFCLSTANTYATQTQWEFFVKWNFNTSGANYIDVWLIANDADLTAKTTEGIFVRIGNAADEISLYKKASNTISKLIDGEDGITAGNNGQAKIRVVRDDKFQWILYRDVTGMGTTFAREGAVIDDAFQSSNFFGISVKQSTSTFFQRHFFDDIEISKIVDDVNPPTVTKITLENTNALNLAFSEPLDLLEAERIENYYVNNSIGYPTKATYRDSNNHEIHLSFEKPFQNDVEYVLSVSNIKDAAGNTLIDTSLQFKYHQLQSYDLVISEIMPDPSPVVGLPEVEWIEITNSSTVPIDLKGFTIKKNNSISGLFPSYNLQPDSSVVVCANGQVERMSVYATTVGVVNFPSLSNDRDLLILQMPNGSTMHAVEFQNTWYNNPIKNNGGWSLEMIDIKNPCAGSSNWNASVNSMGGTPGKKNSVEGKNPDEKTPNVVRAYAVSNNIINIYFDEPLDSFKNADLHHYSVDNGIGEPASVQCLPPMFKVVQLEANQSMLDNTIYNISIKRAIDCVGNTSGGQVVKVGLTSNVDSLDIVINEIMFNPKPFNEDYIELYNRSKKMIDLSTLFVANRNASSGMLGTPIRITNEPTILYAGDYVVLTTNKQNLSNSFHVKNPDNVFEMETLPTFPNDKGSAVILSQIGEIIDELNYSEKWHFALIDNAEGVALERIDADKPTNDYNNWTSASSTENFGTPTYQNSQIKQNNDVVGSIEINPKVISPDNDEVDDYATIQFQFSQPGFMINISIFDALGRLVRVLQRNTSAAASGYFRWDGLNDLQQKVPAGSYIFLTEVFNLNGSKKSYKNVIAVAHKR